MAWTGDEVAVWGESTGADGVGAGGAVAARRRRLDADVAVAPGAGRVHRRHRGEPRPSRRTGRGAALVRGLEGDDSGVPPLYAYDVRADGWTTTDLVVPGYAPPLAVAAGRLLLPDTAAPVVGPLPG